jgi:hypothetical protein
MGQKRKCANFFRSYNPVARLTGMSRRVASPTRHLAHEN